MSEHARAFGSSQAAEGANASYPEWLFRHECYWVFMGTS